MNGIGRDAAMKLWNEAKSIPTALHGRFPASPAQRTPVPEAGFVEYDGTTYYVSPPEFQRRILPDLLRKTGTKKSIFDGKAKNRDNYSGPVIVVTPRWEPESATEIPLETAITPIDHAYKTVAPLLSKITNAPQKLQSTVNDNFKRPRRNHFVQFRYPLAEKGISSFNGQHYKWRFHEEFDQQGRFVAAVNYCLSVQKAPEIVLSRLDFAFTEPKSFMCGGYYCSMYQTDSPPY